MAKTAIALTEASRIAAAVLMDLEPHCERIQVAGSLRRQKPEIGDIEIVAIPRHAPAGLFGDCTANVLWDHLQERADAYRFLMGDTPQARYHKIALRQHGDVQLDLFIADANNWGWIYLLRTGSAAFGQRILGLWKKTHGLWQEPASINGRLVTKGGQPVATPDEETIFALLGIPFVAPEQRQ